MMKRIVTYKMFESAGSGLTQDQEEFLNKYTKGSWKYDPATGLVDVKGSFLCKEKNLKTLSGVKFGKVSGRFDCYNNDLTSLEGAPQKVGGGFDCRGNNLTSLEGAPQKVGVNFLCMNNKLTSLEGAPQEVGGDFDCSWNNLTSLEESPQKVGGGFDCRGNNLTSLEGAPQKVGVNFLCMNNKLTSLEGAPQEVGGDFSCTWNELTSLEGAPQEVGGGFYCDSFVLDPGKWNLEGWLGILKSRKPKAQSLILTILTPDALNPEIQKNPTGMIKKLKPFWNSPGFQKNKKGLKFPAEYGDVDKLIRSMNRFDDMKDLI